MYLGVKKITGLNTGLNITLFFLLVFFCEDKIGFFKFFKIFIFLSVFYVFNIYNLEKGRYILNDFITSFLLNLILVLISFRLYIFDNEIIVFFGNFIFQNLTKIFFYKFCVKDKNILIIGKNEFNDQLKEILESKTYLKIANQIEISKIDYLEKIIINYKINKIVVTEDIKNEGIALKLLNQKLNGIEVYDYFTFYEDIEEKVPVKSIDEKWLLFGKGYQILYRDFNVKVKQIMDLFLAFVVLIVTFPIMLISAICIKLESKGAVIYKQDRVGLGNKEFEIYKFRSMVADAEKNGAQWAIQNDSRITKFGSFMRKTRIDELPQLWNVIKGDMSFVGPRPERMVFIKELEQEIPFYNVRHSVKPGLTGWAQVKYPYGASVEDAHQKLQYDLYYIKNQTIMFDIIILFKTLKVVLSRAGR